MIHKYWYLCRELSIEIKAPSKVIEVLEKNIQLQHSSISNFCFPLEWSFQHYTILQETYWQVSYELDDIVWFQHPERWFLLGKGFFISYHKTHNQAYFYVNEEAFESIFMYSYPLLQLLIPVMSDLGYAPLHSAVLGIDDTFILIPGKQNTGKSTTSASWVLDGGLIVTDDMCLMNIQTPTLAKGFYPTIRLRIEALPLLFKLNSSFKLHQKDYSKYFFNLLPDFESQFVSEANVSAIICLRLDKHNKPFIREANSQLGFEYLASSLAYSKQQHADIRHTFQIIKKITKELPVYQLYLTPDLKKNITFMKEIIHQLH